MVFELDLRLHHGRRYDRRGRGHHRRARATHPTDGAAVEAIVRYAGAQDLYTVSGSPVRTATLLEQPDQAEHRAVHEHIVESLTTLGALSGGKEMPVDLLNR